MKNIYIILLALASLLAVNACTNLDETVYS